MSLNSSKLVAGIDKQEKIFLILSNSTGRYKKLVQFLKQNDWQVERVSNLGDFNLIDSQTGQTNKNKTVCLAIFQPWKDLTKQDLIDLGKFYEGGNAESGDKSLVSYRCASVFIACGYESCDRQAKLTNLNQFLARYGIRLNRESCVIQPNPILNQQQSHQTQYQDFHHPKDAVLENFVANRALSDLLTKHMRRIKPDMDSISSALSYSDFYVPLQYNNNVENNNNNANDNINDSFRPGNTTDSGNSTNNATGGGGAKIVYSHGCTLEVDRKQSTTVLMVSTSYAIPANQAICALNELPPPVGGRLMSSTGKSPQLASASSNAASAMTPINRLIVLGSSELLTDQSIVKENNRALLSALLEVLTDANFSINLSDARTIELPPSKIDPDLSRLSLDGKTTAASITKTTTTTNRNIIVRESFPLPQDKTSLLDSRLFQSPSEHLPKVIRAYKDLNLDQEPSSCLKLIKPQLELPHKLHLEPAVYGFMVKREP